MTDIPSAVVIPARDEQARIAGCLGALAGQTVGRDRFDVILVLDGCRDATAAVALAAARALGLRLIVVPGPGRGPGWARRVGMDLAHALLAVAGPADGLIACTDADSAVAADWLAAQHRHLAGGALAIAGLIELEPGEAAALGDGVLAHRATRAAERLREVRRQDPGAAHHHFGGASFAVTARVYAQVGGIEPLPDLEDAGFAARLAAHGIAVRRALDVRVTTSARRVGRATRGLAVDLDVAARDPARQA